MSKVVVNNTTRTVTVTSTGKPGPVGLNWRGEWAVGVEYQARDAVFHDGSSYRSVEAHTSSEADEPGVSGKWQLLALGSDVQGVADVAAIRDEIVTVAGVKAEVETVAAIGGDVSAVSAIKDDVSAVAAVKDDVSDVAGIKADVSDVAAIKTAISTAAARDADIATVAARADEVGTVASIAMHVTAVADNETNISTVAGKIPEIEAAPQAATAAQAWAEGTQPGGPETKSAKEHAQDAGDSATLAAAARLEDFGVHIFNENGVEPREFFAERYAPADFLLTRFYAEVISGDPAAFANMWVELDGLVVYGPFDVSIAEPVMDEIEIEVPEGGRLNFVLAAIAGGEIIELYAKAWGRVV